MGALRSNFLFIRYRPTAPRSYFFVEKNIFSMNFRAIPTEGASPVRKCWYKSLRASSDDFVGSFSIVFFNIWTSKDSSFLATVNSEMPIFLNSSSSFSVITTPDSATTSPVFLSTISSSKVLFTKFFLLLNLNVLANLNASKISLFDEYPIARNNSVAGNFRRRSIIA